MANRYLRATGNWNGAVWASTSGGTAGSAGVPTIDDDVTINDPSLSVTLTADAECHRLTLIQGTLSLGSYKLTVGDPDNEWSGGEFNATGTSSRTLNLDSGHVEVNSIWADDVGVSGGFKLNSTGLTLNKGTSLITLNITEVTDPDNYIPEFSTSGMTLHDVHINLGVGSDSEASLNVTGSPTFRSLVIQSRNSAAHTVYLLGGVNKVTTLIAVGSSASQRLTLDASETGGVYMAADGSVYGQYLNLQNVPISDYDTLESISWAYGGSNSVQSGSSTWVLEDPPKISTLVDPLTTAPESNTNWTVTGTIIEITTGHGGGGYQISDEARLVSTDIYDLTEDELVFERPAVTSSDGFFGINALGGYGSSVNTIVAGSRGYTSLGYEESYLTYLAGSYKADMLFAYPQGASKYVKVAHDGSAVRISYSTNGTTWTEVTNTTDIDPVFLKSVRVISSPYVGSQQVGSVNPNLGPQAPTANFTASPTSGVAQLEVDFTDSSTGVPTSWLWNFGDSGTSTSQNPTHTYASPGTYTVSLTATNDLGSDTEIKTGYITVSLATIYPDSIASEEAVSDVTITPGATAIYPASTASTEAFGSPKLSHKIYPDSVGSGEAFGTLLITLPVASLGGIASEESVSNISVNGLFLTLPGIDSDEAFGTLLISLFVSDLGDIDSEEDVPEPTLVQSDPPPPPPSDWSAVGKEDEKEYTYKVYDADGNYIGIWTDVKDSLQYTQQINTPGTTTTVQLARSANTTKEARTARITEDGEERITEDGDTRVVVFETPNSVGEDTDVDLNYNVDVYVHYGEFEERITQDGEVRITEDSEERIVTSGAPLGKRVFSGYILDYESIYGETSGVTVTLASHGYELSNELIRDGETTTVEYNSTEVSAGVKDILDDNPGKMGYSTASIDATGVTTTLKFQLNTKLEGIQAFFNQTGDDWYWFGNVADNYVYMKQTSATPDHVFILGKHIKSIAVKRSIESLKNVVYFVGGQTDENDPSTTVFKKYEDATSQTNWRKGLERITDRRYTNTTSMQQRAEKTLGRYKDPIFATPLTISSARYDLESIKLGQTVGFRNFGNFIDNVVLQIVSLSYASTEVTLQLGELQERQVDTVAGLDEDLANEQYQNLPTAPS